ncbi:class I SAM-dependent methyltransferase [Parasulfuritortus cantonensis]|uniref:Class I SAM-dependent methyltransferase n=1 Tax=Parasulfuritortus cantonensis TaxID=2528202 RepID=A0A4R1BD81_9PROT|nr:class I SAM-dependent methyltransferase [Parasulfuritortus cantonensis]TCJ14984.1 class I SAM-dependent methyltransferase [Parasulfuritortus cantonensis]
MEQHRLAARQFGAVADAYLTSAVHARGADLERLGALARGTPGLAVLDLGCGAGHAAFALAAGGARVTAYDLTEAMLAVVEAEAGRRGLAGLATRQGPAERLPFPAAAFDLVVSRYSAHHWADVAGALAEAARVLKPGGSLIMIDIVAPETPRFDTLLQSVELLRDPSHVRDYRVSEWHALLHRAGFRSPAAEVWPVPAEFQSWTGRMRTPEVRVRAIRDLFEQASDDARAHFRVQADGSFELQAAWLEAALARSVAD